MNKWIRRTILASVVLCFAGISRADEPPSAIQAVGGAALKKEAGALQTTMNQKIAQQDTSIVPLPVTDMSDSLGQCINARRLSPGGTLDDAIDIVITNNADYQRFVARENRMEERGTLEGGRVPACQGWEPPAIDFDHYVLVGARRSTGSSRFLESSQMAYRDIGHGKIVYKATLSVTSFEDMSWDMILKVALIPRPQVDVPISIVVEYDIPPN